MNHFNFQKKLFLYYSLLFFVCIILGTTAFSYYTYLNLIKESRQSLEELTLKTSIELDNLFADMDKIALYITANPNIYNAFLDAGQQNKPQEKSLENRISTTLTSIAVPTNAAKYRVALYNSHGDFVSTGRAYDRIIQKELFSSPTYPDWYAARPILSKNRSISCFQDDYLLKGGEPILSLYREIYNPFNINSPTGIVEIQCPYNYVHNILTLSDAESYLFDNTGRLIFPLEENSSAMNSLYLHFKQNSFSSSNNYENGFYAADISDFSGFTLIVTRSNASVISIIKPIILLLLLLAVSILCFSLFWVFYISRMISKPLIKLTHSVEQVSLSNFSLEINSDRKIDEFEHLNAAFTDMFSRLHTSMNEILKMKEHEMQAHMIALQSQMDPHFLYNMLTIIKSMSRQNDATHIGLVCDYLVRMLRYNSTYNEDYVTMETEIAHTQDYLQLMKVRYEDMFEYQIELTSGIDTETIEVPKLCLQPIVENCFQHGFKQVPPPWKLNIRCWSTDNRWYISVIDNGIGIRQEEIDTIYLRINDFLENPSDELNKLKIGGMGLINTIARFQLKYKQDITFEIKALENGGTRVVIGGNCYDKPIISRR